MNFTRNTALSLFVLTCLALGGYVVLRSLISRRKTTKDIKWVATGLVGVGIIAATATSRSTEALDVMRFRIEDTSGITSIVIAFVAIAVGIAIGDYLWGRVIPSLSALVGGRLPDTKSNRAMIFAALTIAFGAVTIVGIVVGLATIDPTVEGVVSNTTNLQIELLADHELPAEPRDLVFLNARSGFISFPNSITHFAIVGDVGDGRIELTDRTPSAEIINPRGLALGGGFLFVSEQGDREENAPGDMYSTNGAVVRFAVGPGGELTDRKVLIDQVPIASSLHGINGMAVGPDDHIYLSIGGTKSELSPETPNAGWVGTILRFDFDGGNVHVFARGLRNVYDLEFDARGRLWAVDNDGPTLRDYRAEEVLQIKEGAHYGYPFEGTYGPHSIRTDPPLGAFAGHDLEGTAGIELAENLDIGTGLLVGARVLHLFQFAEDSEGPYFSGEFDRQGNQVLFSRQGYFTIVEASEEGLLFAGVTGLSLNSNLYILRISK